MIRTDRNALRIIVLQKYTRGTVKQKGNEKWDEWRQQKNMKDNKKGRSRAHPALNIVDRFVEVWDGVYSVRPRCRGVR